MNTTKFNAQTRNGRGFTAWDKEDRIPVRDYQPVAVVEARRRLEDMRMARELGLDYLEVTS